MIIIGVGEDTPHEDVIMDYCQRHRRDLSGAADQPLLFRVNGILYKVYSQLTIEEITKE